MKKVLVCLEEETHDELLRLAVRTRSSVRR